MHPSPTPAPTSLAEQWSTQGFVSLPQILAPAELESLSLPLLAQGAQGGSRNLLQERWCAQLAQQLRQHPRMAPLIGAQSVAVQCTYFEKSADRNWLVALHQDLSIPVAEQVPAAGLHGWSQKQDCWFVQAPAVLLSQLVAVRLHFDDCSSDDGPLRVVPGSHQQAILSPEQALQWRSRQSEEVCTAHCGDVLVLRPLLLHASSKGRGHSRRRVLHFLYGPSEPGYGLRWACIA